MTECPALNTLSSNLDVVNTDNESQLRLSTYTRTVGYNVELSCLNGYTLVGQKNVICQNGGIWNFSSKPYCEADNSSGLSDSMKILIGALVGGIFLFLAIVILIACLIRRKKKKLSEDEKFCRHLQEEDLPRGHKPGEMVNEIQYRPPSYAHAWPALSHISFVGKKEYPFRPPETETNSNTLHAGKSIWDNNDYFFGKPDIDSNKTETMVTEARHTRRVSADNTFPKQSDAMLEYNQMSRRRSLSGGQDNFAYRDPAPKLKKEYYQKDTPYTVYNDKYPYGKNWNINEEETNSDVVVEVRIPSRYLKPNEEVIGRYYPNDQQYTKVLPPIPDNHARSSPSIHTEKAVAKAEEKKPKDVYQGNWPMRQEIKSLNEFNKRALLHNRDPYLWRPVDTNFGFDAWLDAKF